MQNTLVIISDYGVGDPSFTEVMLKFRTLLPDTFVIPQAATPFSTLNTGFWISQIALTPNLKNTYIFSNTAPRTEDYEAQKENDGEKLMYAKLKNGFELMAIHAGFCFSFVKPYIEEYYFVKTNSNGSQFRSRDYFPFAVLDMIQGNKSFLGELGDVAKIPDYPRNVIASIDGYGNIKTTIRMSEIPYASGEKLTININERSHEALFSTGIFNTEHNSLVFAPGSSGQDDKFLEIVLRGGSAASLFGSPTVEDSIALRKRG